MVTHSFITNIAKTLLLTLAQAKKHLKVGDDVTYEDALISEYNEGAQIACQDFINRSIAKRDFVMQSDDFEIGPFASNYENDVITKIEYYAPDGTLTELANDQYQLRKSTVIECFEIKFFSKPEIAKRDDAVIVTIAQGFTAAECPKPILQAIKLRIASSYIFREDGNGNNTASNNLLRPYRKY